MHEKKLGENNEEKLKFKCDNCHINWQNKHNIKNHKKSVHENPCDKCDFTLNSKGNF